MRFKNQIRVHKLYIQKPVFEKIEIGIYKWVSKNPGHNWFLKIKKKSVHKTEIIFSIHNPF